MILNDIQWLREINAADRIVGPPTDYVCLDELLRHAAEREGLIALPR